MNRSDRDVSYQEAPIIAGRNPVREALREEAALEKVLLQKGVEHHGLSEIRRLARQVGVPVQVVPKQKLERLVPGVNHQGVLALPSAVAYLDVDDMLRRIAPDADAVRSKKPIVVVLDGIQDPHNLGAILRSAVAAGAEGAIVPDRGGAPMGASAMKASAGTARHIPIARVANIADAIMQLKERGYWVVGADGEGEHSVWDMDWSMPLALVIGSEGEGMHRRVASACDYRVHIPMSDRAESLNASVAAGILLFAAVRGRDIAATI